MFEPKCSSFTFFRLTFRLHKLFLCCASQLLCLQITTLLIKITSHLQSYFYAYKLLTKLQVTYKVISYLKSYKSLTSDLYTLKNYEILLGCRLTIHCIKEGILLVATLAEWLRPAEKRNQELKPEIRS